MAAARRLPRARVEAQEGVAQIAAWIWTEMRSRNLNQAQTAAALGVSLGRLREWLEADPPRPTPNACAAIAQFLGRPTEEILRLAGRNPQAPPSLSRDDRPEVAAFSDWLSAELTRRGLSRKDAAAAIGMHPRAMANWFGPHPRRPSAQMYERLAQLLEVGVDEVRERAGYPAEHPNVPLVAEQAPADLPESAVVAPVPLSATRTEPGETENSSDQIAIRTAALQTAATFLAQRPGATIDDVESLATRWVRWIRHGS